jgi:hypothetical protein
MYTAEGSSPYRPGLVRSKRGEKGVKRGRRRGRGRGRERNRR